MRRRGASTATRRCLCAGGTCAKGRRPEGLSRGPADAGPSTRRCLIQVKEVRPWSGMAMRGLSAAERHLHVTSAHPPLALRSPFDPGFFPSVAWDAEAAVR